MQLCRALGADRVGVYLAVGSELDTAPLIRALRRSGRSVFVPRIDRAGRMAFVRPGAPRALRKNRHGIAEPGRATDRADRRLDLLVVPLLAFDAAGNRLGAGGGYYDRWLARCAPGRPYRLGYAFAVQAETALPAQPWDQPLDAVVTERGLMRCRSRSDIHSTPT